MAGVKGKSGRKSRYTEIQEGKLEKVCTDYLIENFDSFDTKTKVKVATIIASKAVTQKTESKVSIEETQKEIQDQIHSITNRLSNDN